MPSAAGAPEKMALEYGSQNEVSSATSSSSSHDNYRRYLESQLSANVDNLSRSSTLVDSSRSTTPLADASQVSQHERSASETMRLVNLAIQEAEKHMQESVKNSQLDSNIAPSLTVDLSRKNIEILPDDIVGVLKQSVERIVLSHNRISRLPLGFSECINITYLSLRDNRFKEFPTALFTLEKLQVLDMSRNELAKLPEELRNMKSLRYLSLMHNRLESLPYSLGFLESLRLLKLGSNPLNPTLQGLVDGDESSLSPTNAKIREHEKEAVVTVKIKHYLKSEATTLESPADSSGESYLETPRPLKRSSTTLRFPVVPIASPEDALRGQRSPKSATSLFNGGNHWRMASGNSISDKSFINGKLYPRPLDAIPSFLSNERNRSSSESLVPTIQNSRSKRMGIMSRQPRNYKPMHESSLSRSSLHFRGSSHGSALKEKHSGFLRSGLGSGSSKSTSPIDDRHQRAYFRRLSSVPEQRSQSGPTNRVVEAARGLVWAFVVMQPALEIAQSLLSDDTTQRSGLQRAYRAVVAQTTQLNDEVTHWDQAGSWSKKRKIKALHSIRETCKTCMAMHREIFDLIAQNALEFLEKADDRYARMLQVVLSWAGMEIGHANQSLLQPRKSLKTPMPQKKPPRAVVKPPKLNLVPSTAATNFQTVKTVPAPPRRYRSETVSSFRSQQSSLRTAPTLMNVGSTSNSRTGFAPMRSRSSSRSAITANGDSNGTTTYTPQSEGSFLFPGTPGVSELIEVNGKKSFDSHVSDDDSKFERIYLGFSKTTAIASPRLKDLIEQLTERIDQAIRAGDKNQTDMWTRIHTRARQFDDQNRDLQGRLAKVKLNDRDIRNSRDFWRNVTRHSKAFITLIEQVQRDTASYREELQPLKANWSLKPIHAELKIATHTLSDSRWAWVIDDHSPPPTAISISSSAGHWPNGGGSGGSSASGMLGPHRLHGQIYRQGDSATSPYIPTTPLSAALGPAAQATIPTSATSANSGYSTGTLLDRSFQGDVFQRATQLLNSVPSLRETRR